MQHGGTTIADRLAWAFRRVTSRSPTSDEARVLAATFDKVRAKYSDDPSAGASLLKVGQSPRDAKLDVVEHATYTAISMLILNLDETLTKQ
jgi:hypothetical protein